MISRETFTREHIENLQQNTGADPSILERTVFAFGLLEAIRKTNLPFIFKGGTALISLLDNPRRLSTDIDIVVPEGTDIDDHIRKAGTIFPFLGVEENMRRKSGGIEKRHFRFSFTSPRRQVPVTVLLDVVFENDPYVLTVQRPVNSGLLLSDGDSLYVTVPDKNCILADKLTAFAPHTAGVPFGKDKELEIIKQFFDCWTLLGEMDDYSRVCEAYDRLVRIELSYRDLHMDSGDVLLDTIRSCICMIGRGSIGEEYPLFLKGITAIRGHIFNGELSGETAAYKACEIMHLAACMMTEAPYERPDPKEYMGENLKIKGAKRITYMRHVSPEAYACLIRSFRILNGVGLFKESVECTRPNDRDAEKDRL